MRNLKPIGAASVAVIAAGLLLGLLASAPARAQTVTLHCDGLNSHPDSTLQIDLGSSTATLRDPDAPQQPGQEVSSNTFAVQITDQTVDWTVRLPGGYSDADIILNYSIDRQTGTLRVQQTDMRPGGTSSGNSTSACKPVSAQKMF